MTSIGDLPVGTILRIVQYVPPRSLASLRATARLYAAIVCSHTRDLARDFYLGTVLEKIYDINVPIILYHEVCTADLAYISVRNYSRFYPKTVAQTREMLDLSLLIVSAGMAAVDVVRNDVMRWLAERVLTKAEHRVLISHLLLIERSNGVAANRYAKPLQQTLRDFVELYEDRRHKRNQLYTHLHRYCAAEMRPISSHLYAARCDGSQCDQHDIYAGLTDEEAARVYICNRDPSHARDEMPESASRWLKSKLVKVYITSQSSAAAGVEDVPALMLITVLWNAQFRLRSLDQLDTIDWALSLCRFDKYIHNRLTVCDTIAAHEHFPITAEMWEYALGVIICRAARFEVGRSQFT